MKKLAIVLLMGLAIGMTFMSCSKEEVQVEIEATVALSGSQKTLVIGMPYCFNCESFNIQVLDVLSREVIPSRELPWLPKLKVDISQLAVGTYYLVITSGDKYGSYPFLKSIAN
tara:strand:- start:445 stop:786 length:342 start_codon:yes stop_codon:yes gene_type:complete